MSNRLFYVYHLNPDGSPGAFLGRVSCRDAAAATAVMSDAKSVPAYELEAREGPKETNSHV